MLIFRHENRVHLLSSAHDVLRRLGDAPQHVEALVQFVQQGLIVFPRLLLFLFASGNRTRLILHFLEPTRLLFQKIHGLLKRQQVLF